MNIIKIGLLLVTGLGFGFGVDSFTNLDQIENEQDNLYTDVYPRYCHNEEYYIEHLLQNLTEEEQILVQNKIDQLLLEYNLSIEEMLNDIDIRHEFMYELMEFMYDNDIEYHYHNNNEWHHGMRTYQ